MSDSAPAAAPSTRPRVSVGLPVFNGERHLETALRSILAQTFEDIELVICDNASTDRTEQICRDFAARDGRVRYHRNPENVGAQRNHNLVFELSRGHYFRWAGHDDVMEPPFLERCVAVLDRDPRYVLAFTRFDVIDDNGDLVGHGNQPPAFRHLTPHRRLRALWASAPVHQVIYGVFRREALERTALLGDWYASDRALLLELAVIGGFACVDEVLHHHREHPGRSIYDPARQHVWAPQTIGTPDVGHFKRLKHALTMPQRQPLPPGEWLRIAAECGRYGVTRLPYWTPRLLEELAGVIGLPVGPGRRSL